MQITKETCPYVLAGGNICYTITVTNNSDVDVLGVLFNDEIPVNTEYITGSFRVNDEVQTPMMADNIIQYPIDVLANGSEGDSVKIDFCVKVSTGT